jgi:hypothetical protein
MFSPNSGFKNLAVSVMGKKIRHEVPCWAAVQIDGCGLLGKGKKEDLR